MIEELRRECEEVCTSSCHADDCEHHGYLPDAARASQPITATALPAHGFAENRPNGPRTLDGHALGVNLRQKLPGWEVNLDDWIRTIEDQAVALAALPVREDAR